MTCATCKGNAIATMACVETALEAIRQHFIMLQSLSCDHIKLISSLQANNDKLSKALEQQSTPQSHLGKRRKLESSPTKTRRHCSSADSSLHINNLTSPLPQTQDSLNMNIALNNALMFDEDKDDDDEDETIAETEHITPLSPDCQSLTMRRKLFKRHGENIKPDSTASSTSKIPKEENTLATRRIPLTLKSNVKNPGKLKQTRLKYGVAKPRENKDIEASPNLYTSLKNANQTRSFLLRSETGSKEHTKISKPKFGSDDDEQFFDFTSPRKESWPNSAQQSLQIPQSKSNSSSVIMLTPATQDIVFVDDSSDDSRQLNTLDIIDSLTQLNKQEAKAITKQKKQFKKQNTKPSQGLPSCIKNEPLTESNADLCNESTKLLDDIDKYNDDQDEDEEFPRPIVVKREETLKERFNINCLQCEKYVNFMHGSLTELQIENYLLNCKHPERWAPNSPDGFWNPHMISFAEDDPRNEVLVDHRFQDKKRAQ